MAEQKVCNKCGVSKPKTEMYFGRSRNTKDGWRAECKECRNNRLRNHWNEDKTKLRCQICNEYKPPEEFNHAKKPHRANRDLRCKACKSKAAKERRMQRYKTDHLRRLLVERVAAAKDRAKKKGIYCDITLEEIQQLWEDQKGKCAISGLPMTYEMGKGRVHSNVSIDKKDPDKGYTISNIQLVCMAVNQMKSDMTTDTLIDYCRAILDNNNNIL